MASCGDGFGALAFGLTRRPPMPAKPKTVTLEVPAELAAKTFF